MAHVGNLYQARVGKLSQRRAYAPDAQFALVSLMVWSRKPCHAAMYHGFKPFQVHFILDVAFVNIYIYIYIYIYVFIH